MRKKILVSDAAYVLLQPWLVYFAFGDGKDRIPPQIRFVLMALVGLMMMVNLFLRRKLLSENAKRRSKRER